MNMWKLISGVVLLLLVGILFGSIGTWILIKPPRPPGPGDHRNRTAEAVDRLSKDLNLTREQRGAVEKILQQMSQRLHERFLRDRPEIEKIMDEGFNRMREHLTDEQKKKLDEVRKRFGRFRGGPGPGPGHEPPFGPPPPPPPSPPR